MSDNVTLFDDEKSLLVAHISDSTGRKAFSVDGRYGLAVSELQFRKALSFKEHPEVRKWTAGEIISARNKLAAEWAKDLQAKEEKAKQEEPKEEVEAPKEDAPKPPKGRARKKK